MKQLITIIVFALSSLLTLNNCRKEEPQINNVSDFEEYISDEMNHQKIPAASVLIFKNEQILYEKYFGLSNIEEEVALERNHIFLLASISKTITSTALLQLYDQGYFQLDDKINDFLSFEVKVPNMETEITFKMLLTHTSAIADGSALDEQYYYGQDSPLVLSDFLENYLVAGGQYYNSKENFFDFEPGTSFEYSNTGAALIAVLVEEISDIDFNTYCKQNIFEPLGMTNTFWRLDEISQPIVQPYEHSFGRYKAIEHYTFTDYPNGGLRSNTQDMFMFLCAFAQNGTFNNYQLLKPETVSSVITPQIPNIDNAVGLHMFLLNSDNNLWGHDGEEQGVATIMAFNPNTQIGALIFTNKGDANLDNILIEAYKLGLILQ
jgi:CubicO group peptidase (beta-lactamase class C family)